MTVEIISFDLDGTLVKDSFVKKFWFKEVPRLYSNVHGTEFQESLRRVKQAYDEVGPEDIRWYRPSYWFERFDLDVDPRETVEDIDWGVEYFDDALEVLDSLSGLLDLAVITNSPRIFIGVQLESIDDFFSQVYSCPSDFGDIKSSEDVYFRICEDLGIQPSELMHVGDDSFYDYEIPEKVGIDSFVIDREDGDEAKDRLADLREILEMI